MEEGVLHIKLVNWPVLGVSKREDSTDGGRFDDRTERFIVINSRALGEATKNPAGFVAIKGAISMKLVSENPFSSDYICVTRARNKVPGMVVMEGSALFFHGLAPVGISQSIPVGARDWGEYL
jgi:hypothetical protein